MENRDYITEELKSLINTYVNNVRNIYGSHLRNIILYGSYARGDFNEYSDIDIMILVDLNDMDIKKYGDVLSDMTFDYNLDNDLDIKPIAKNETHFNKWVGTYPFYSNVRKEGVVLYEAA